MTSSQMGNKGGKKRWRGTTKRERSDEMSRVAKLGWPRKVRKRAK